MREEFVIMVYSMRARALYSKAFPSSIFSAVHQYSGLLCGRFLDSQRQSTPTSNLRPTVSAVFSLRLLGYFHARRGHSGKISVPFKKLVCTPRAFLRLYST